MNPTKTQKSSFLDSFKFAFSGIKQALKKERNLKLHFLAAFLAVFFGFVFGLSKLEWLVIILLIGVVISAELFNSAIESLGDLLKEKLKLSYQETTFIRNASASAVLVMAIVALLIGLIVFLS